MLHHLELFQNHVQIKQVKQVRKEQIFLILNGVYRIELS